MVFWESWKLKLPETKFSELQVKRKDWFIKKSFQVNLLLALDVYNTLIWLMQHQKEEKASSLKVTRSHMWGVLSGAATVQYMNFAWMEDPVSTLVQLGNKYASKNFVIYMLSFIHWVFSCSRGYHGQRCELKYANTGSKGAAMSDRFWKNWQYIYWNIFILDFLCVC